MTMAPNPVFGGVSHWGADNGIEVGFETGRRWLPAGEVTIGAAHLDNPGAGRLVGGVAAVDHGGGGTPMCVPGRRCGRAGAGTRGDPPSPKLRSAGHEPDEES